MIYHKKLDVYRLALDFVVLTASMVKRLPRGEGHHADQLRRAAGSICYNIGEGAGEFSGPEKARFYRIALRSATESSTVIDIIFSFGYIRIEEYKHAEQMLERIIGMLTKLIQCQAAKGQGATGTGAISLGAGAAALGRQRVKGGLPR